MTGSRFERKKLEETFKGKRIKEQENIAKCVKILMQG